MKPILDMLGQQLHKGDEVIRITGKRPWHYKATKVTITGRDTQGRVTFEYEEDRWDTETQSLKLTKLIGRTIYPQQFIKVPLC